MISLFCKLMIGLCDVLPENPFTGMVDGLETLSDIMGYLNWFIPFKSMLAMLTTWAGCMTAWYVYKNGKGVISKILK